MMIVVETTARVGHSSGKMIPRKTCHSVAPSTRAASSSSALMPLRAAEMMTMQKPVHIQAMTRISRIVLKLKSLRVSHGLGPDADRGDDARSGSRSGACPAAGSRT